MLITVRDYTLLPRPGVAGASSIFFLVYCTLCLTENRAYLLPSNTIRLPQGIEINLYLSMHY